MTGPSGQAAPVDEAVRLEAAKWRVRLGSLPGPDVLHAFEAWYQADPGHAEVYDGLLETWDMSGLASQAPVGQERDRLAKYRSQNATRRLLLIAASVLLGLAVCAGLGFKLFGVAWSQAAQQAQFVTGVGEKRVVTLPDGSRVTLDAGTSLAVSFTRTERRLTLESGRARFDVAHDPDHPFIVNAGGSVVIAHGTIFDVDLRGHKLAVSLLRGSVEVKKKPDAVPGLDRHGQFLVPGQRLAMALGEALPVPLSASSDEPDWITGMLSFDDRPLSEVIAVVNRSTATPIVLADPRLGTLRFTGTVAAKDTAGLAQVLAASFKLTVSRDEHGHYSLARQK